MAYCESYSTSTIQGVLEQRMEKTIIYTCTFLKGFAKIGKSFEFSVMRVANRSVDRRIRFCYFVLWQKYSWYRYMILYIQYQFHHYGLLYRFEYLQSFQGY